VLNQAEAEQMARGGFNRAVLDLITADGTCVGRPDLRPGIVIKLDGIGTRFSGQYYIKATSHCYSSTSAYQTHFVAWRNAS
jgi:phage protein D